MHIARVRVSSLLIFMPAITRSQTRAQLDHLKNAPYPIDILARIKSKYPENHGKIQNLLNKEITPPPEAIIDAIMEIAGNCMDEVDEVKKQNAQFRAFHTLGDILYKCLTPVRKHIYEKTKKNTSAFIGSSEEKGIDDDTTEEADILKEFIKQAKNKAKHPSYIETHFQRYKTWLRMYAKRCELVHSGFDDMEPQDIWNALRDIERDVNSETIVFENPDWKDYALKGIMEMRICKFNWKNDRWEDKKGNPIDTL